MGNSVRKNEMTRFAGAKMRVVAASTRSESMNCIEPAQQNILRTQTQTKSETSP
jgi:hypothetical protein